MIILGVDPGPEKSAYIEWDHINKKIYNIGIVNNKDFISNCIRYNQFKHNLFLAIEVPKIFGNKVWQQVIDTAFIAGQIVGKINFPFKKVAPNEWKLHITGKRGANDQLVKQALMARFGPKGTKKNPGKLYGLKTHLWDTLGIAVYVGDTHEI